MSLARTAKREVLNGLLAVLGMIAGKLHAQSTAATEVAALAAEAETLAAKFWQFSKSRFPDSKTAVALAREVDAFIREAAAVAEQAARETALTRDISVILHEQTGALRHVAQTLDGVDDMAQLRRNLSPIVEALMAVPARMQGTSAVATDVAMLSEGALQLAYHAETLHQKARTPGIAAVAVYKDLRDFAATAGAVARQIAETNTTITRSMTDLTAQAEALRTPMTDEARTEAQTLGRMKTVIEHGVAARAAHGMTW